MSFVPRDFNVPTSVDQPDFRLRVLSPLYAELDFAAVMATKPHMPRIFLDPSWPAEVVDHDSNLRFIREDFADFEARRGFSYIILDPAERECLGCLYLFPSFFGDHDVAVYYWVHHRLMGGAFEAKIGAFAKQWVNSSWPFKNPAFPGREISWDDWTAKPRARPAH